MLMHVFEKGSRIEFGKLRDQEESFEEECKEAVQLSFGLSALLARTFEIDKRGVLTEQELERILKFLSGYLQVVELNSIIWHNEQEKLIADRVL